MNKTRIGQYNCACENQNKNKTHPERGDVKRFEELSLVGGSVSVHGHGDVGLLVVLVGEGEARADRGLGACGCIGRLRGQRRCEFGCLESDAWGLRLLAKISFGGFVGREARGPLGGFGTYRRCRCLRRNARPACTCACSRPCPCSRRRRAPSAPPSPPAASRPFPDACNDRGRT